MKKAAIFLLCAMGALTVGSAQAASSCILESWFQGNTSQIRQYCDGTVTTLESNVQGQLGEVYTLMTKYSQGLISQGYSVNNCQYTDTRSDYFCVFSKSN